MYRCCDLACHSDDTRKVSARSEPRCYGVSPDAKSRGSWPSIDTVRYVRQPMVTAAITSKTATRMLTSRAELQRGDAVLIGFELRAAG
jgi:hypothetical protein